MNFSAVAAFIISSIAAANAFSIPAGKQLQCTFVPSTTCTCTLASPKTRAAYSHTTSQLFMSDFESDLPSAMPEKLDTTQFIADVESRLAEGVSVPPVLESLREARDTGADTNVLTGLIYELMIE